MSDARDAHQRPPIACALDGSSMKGRVAEWASLARRALVERRPHPSGVALRYRRDANAESELLRLIALERECCAFLEFHLEQSPTELSLTVSGPEEAVLLIRECWGVSDADGGARALDER